MPISNSTLLSGATVSAAGGSSKTFSVVGETIKNGIKVMDTSVTDARLRPTLTCINRPAQMSAGVYISKDKKTMKLVSPKVIASGAIVYNVREVRIEDHPETTDAERDILDGYTAQLMFDSDFTAFRRYGAVS